VTDLQSKCKNGEYTSNIMCTGLVLIVSATEVPLSKEYFPFGFQYSTKLTLPGVLLDNTVEIDLTVSKRMQGCFGVTVVVQLSAGFC